MGKVKLMEIVAQFVDSADLSEHQARRIYNIAVRGAKELNLDVYGAIKSMVLPVNDNKTIDIPKDFIRLSKIGVLNDAGEVVTLQVNNDMATLRSQYIESLGKTVDVPTIPGGIDGPGWPIGNYLWLNYVGMGYDYGCQLWGLGSGGTVIGTYRIDENDGLIYLSEDWPYDVLLMEYVSDGFDSACGDFMVDSRASEAMLAWIRWQQSFDLKKKYSAGEVQLFRKEYYNQKRLSKLRINSVDINQMEVIYRQHIKLAARA